MNDDDSMGLGLAGSRDWPDAPEVDPGPWRFMEVELSWSDEELGFPHED